MNELVATTDATRPTGGPAPSEGLGRPFHLLWLGQSASLVGDQVTVIALPLVAVGYAGATTFGVGLLSTLLKLPFLLIGLPAGVWVTRLGLGRSMLFADIVRGAALATITLALISRGAISLATLAAAVACVGAATVFFQVAYQSFVPDVVPHEERWHGANLRLSLSESMSLVVGPALGGLLISAVSIAGALLLDATTYVVSVVTIAALLRLLRVSRSTSRASSAPPSPSPSSSAQPSTSPSSASEPTGMVAAIRAGFAHVRTEPVLAGIMWTGALYNIGSAMFESMLVLFAVRSLGLSPGAVGAAVGVGAAGYPLGGLLSAELNRRLGRGRVLWLAGIPSVIGIAVVGLAAGQAAVLVLGLGVFIVGIGQGAFSVNAVTLRQLHSAPTMRARATSVHRFTSWGAVPIGTMLAGLVGATIGLRAVMLIAAALAGLCFIPLSARQMRTAP